MVPNNEFTVRRRLFFEVLLDIESYRCFSFFSCFARAQYSSHEKHLELCERWMFAEPKNKIKINFHKDIENVKRSRHHMSVMYLVFANCGSTMQVVFNAMRLDEFINACKYARFLFVRNRCNIFFSWIRCVRQSQKLRSIRTQRIWRRVYIYCPCIFALALQPYFIYDLYLVFASI